MGPVTHQTIRLSKGKHTSKDHGACVMELASMLADEPFSDHPGSVCPVIGSLLRAYNDSIDDRRRQDLYAYAAKVVGSRGPAQLERERAERVCAWMSKPGWARLDAVPAAGAVARGHPEAAARRARRERGSLAATHDDRTHARMLALIDSLLAMGGPEQAPSAPSPVSAPSPRQAERTPAR